MLIGAGTSAHAPDFDLQEVLVNTNIPVVLLLKLLAVKD